MALRRSGRLSVNRRTYGFGLSRRIVSMPPPWLRAVSLVTGSSCHRIAIYMPCSVYNQLGIHGPMTAFEVVAEPRRRQILDLLARRELPVGELVRRLRMSQ